MHRCLFGPVATQSMRGAAARLPQRPALANGGRAHADPDAPALAPDLNRCRRAQLASGFSFLLSFAGVRPRGPDRRRLLRTRRRRARLARRYCGPPRTSGWVSRPGASTAACGRCPGLDRGRRGSLRDERTPPAALHRRRAATATPINGPYRAGSRRPGGVALRRRAPAVDPPRRAAPIVASGAGNPGKAGGIERHGSAQATATIASGFRRPVLSRGPYHAAPSER